MKFFKFLPALIVAVALVGIGCGGNNQSEQTQTPGQQQAQARQSELENTLREVNSQLATLQRQLDSVSEENSNLKSAVQELQNRSNRQDIRLSDASGTLDQIRDTIAEGADPGVGISLPAALSNKNGSEGGIGTILFLFLVVVIGLLIIVLIVRAFAGGRNEFDEEDDEFDDLDEEDFGFEDDDEDFEDELEDEKPAPKTAAKDKKDEKKDDAKKEDKKDDTKK